MNLSDKIKEEGNYHEWEYTAQNGSVIKCCIKRHPSIGHLCGYVFLTKDMKFWGKDYDDIHAQVHGGLTYASYDDEDNWVVGFDCAHSGDLTPYSALDLMDININSFYGVYRDKEYVISECESLAEQLSEWGISKIRDVKLGKLI